MLAIATQIRVPRIAYAKAERFTNRSFKSSIHVPSSHVRAGVRGFLGFASTYFCVHGGSEHWTFIVVGEQSGALIPCLVFWGDTMGLEAQRPLNVEDVPWSIWEVRRSSSTMPSANLQAHHSSPTNSRVIPVPELLVLFWTSFQRVS